MLNMEHDVQFCSIYLQGNRNVENILENKIYFVSSSSRYIYKIYMETSFILTRLYISENFLYT